MTKDDIIDMAKEAAAKHGHTFKEGPNDAVLEIIAEVYAMGTSAEREACAVICDNRVLYTGYDCAAAIRSRDVYKMGWPIGDPRDILKCEEIDELRAYIEDMKRHTDPGCWERGCCAVDNFKEKS